MDMNTGKQTNQIEPTTKQHHNFEFKGRNTEGTRGRGTDFEKCTVWRWHNKSWPSLSALADGKNGLTREDWGWRMFRNGEVGQA